MKTANDWSKYLRGRANSRPHTMSSKMQVQIADAIDALTAERDELKEKLQAFKDYERRRVGNAYETLGVPLPTELAAILGREP